MEDWPGLAERLLDGIGDRVSVAGRPTWVGVRDDPLGQRDIGMWFSEDPYGFLGWEAPPECIAVGVVATGRAHVADTPTEAPAPFSPGPIPGIRMCCLVTRRGEVTWRMTLPDGRSFGDAPQEGRLLDCLRRCFALPTSPPPAGPGQLLSVFWLGAIIDEDRRVDRGLTWREISRLHPLATMMSSGTGMCDDLQDVSIFIRAATSTWSWETLRVRAVTDSWAGELVSPELAAWMDDGMFARWILGALPAPDELLVRLRPRLAPSTARRLAHAVRSAQTA
jgi:hypothetical protein